MNEKESLALATYMEQPAPPRWEQPAPLSAPPPPVFRAEWLPGVFGEYAAALAEFTQTPVDLPACLILGAVNAASLGLYEIAADWREPWPLFVCVSMGPSERKSPVFAAVRRPLDEWEKSENACLSPEIARNKAKRALLDKRLQKAMQKDDEAEVMRLTDELTATPELHAVRLIAADATPEATTRLMAENGGRLAVIDSEGGVFDTIAGRYASGMPNLDVYLHGFSGEPVRVDRVGREPFTIHKAQMTVILAVQPDVVRGVFANRSMTARGLAARFLWCQPESMAGRRQIDVTPVSEALVQSYERTVTALLDARRGPSPLPLNLTGDARRAFRDWQREIETRLTDDLQPLKEWGWAGKLAGLTLRLAGTLAVMDKAEAIDARALLTAVDISRWAIEHARAVSFGMDSGGESPAAALLEVIRRDTLFEFTLRDIQRKLGGRKAFQNADAVRAALAELEQAGYVRKAALTAEELQRRVCRWEVNPLALMPAGEVTGEVMEL